MKEELRLVIAFALAVIIILLFGRTQVPKRQETQTKEESTITVREEQETQEKQHLPFTPEPEAPTASEEVTYENKQYVVKIDTFGGAIKDIGLKKHTRKGENTLTLFEGSNLLLNYSSEDEEVKYSSVQKTDGVINLRSPGKKLLTEKRFEIPEDSYTFISEIQIYNTDKKMYDIKDYVISAGEIDIAKMQAKSKTEKEFTPPEIMIHTNGRMVKYNIFRVKENATYENTNWIALKQGYGLLFLRPERATRSFVTIEGTHLKTGLLYNNIKIKPSSSESIRISFYAGPSDYFVAGKEIPDKEVLGTGFFAAMGRFLFTALSYIHKVIPNWGWAIVILTLVIKIVFFPLTQKSLRSMKAMQKLRPYLQDIQKKYKGNPQQMQKELMNLYKEYKINPFGGCLPMLIQFPIFIGFFIALRNSIFLRGAPFILWMNDLSRPDTIMRLGNFNINLLPIIMAATSFWQQKLTPQEPSQKALTFMMPLMFLFLFYNFSSGLLLYWTTMNIAGLVEQYFIHKK
jgi:YidC/Oxa1 family membrane protein insertase